MSDNFLRQRRNLMITSILIFVMSFGAIELDKIVSIAGIKLTIGNPLIIYITIFLIFIYFFIRYMQYYFELESEYKDYNFYITRWGGYNDDIFYGNKYIVSMKVIYHTVIFIIENIHFLVNFIFHSLFRKDFSETLFPIILALFVGILSWNSQFVNSKKDAGSKVFSDFYEQSIQMTCGNVESYINSEILNLKQDINYYYKDIMGENLFVINKKDSVYYIK